MAQVISIHSYRRGTGKTSITVNLAVLMALAGKRTGIVDAAFLAPSTQFFFYLEKDTVKYSFNDFLDQHCEINDAVYDLTSLLGTDVPGRLFLTPANINVRTSLTSGSGYHVEQLEAGIEEMVRNYALDIVLMDTSAGKKDETLMPLVISDLVIEILRLDQQDYQGTAVVTEIARKLEIPQVCLVANNISTSQNPAEVKKEIEDSFGLEVAGVLPVSEEMLELSEGEIFVLKHPTHPITHTLQGLVDRIK